MHDLTTEQWHHALHQCVYSVDIDGESTHLVKEAVSKGAARGSKGQQGGCEHGYVTCV